MYPNLFHIGPFTLHSYGLMLAIAFFAAIQIVLHYGKQELMKPGPTLDLVFYIFISALVGAKLLILIVDFHYYSADWHRLLGLYQVGGVFYGGLILAVIVSAWYMRKHQMNFWKTADVFCMGIVTGQMIGRLGCFFAGCCWGKAAPPGFPLAVTFTNPFAADQVGTPLGIPLYPVQLIEAAALLVILLILIYSYRYRKFIGQQLCLYLLLYSIARFSLEFLRGDPRGSAFNGLLSTSQFISVIMFMFAIAIYFYRKDAKVE